MRAAIAAALLCAALAGAAPASVAAKEVRYGRYSIEVPSSWPVYRLAERPRTCVRFDRHAVYLGSPSAEQRCPAHAVGRSEAILVEPRAGAAPATGPSVRAPAGSARPGELPEARSDREVRVEGLSVTATWSGRRHLVRRILERATLRPRGTVPAAPRAQSQQVAGAAAPRAAFRKGLGFDACTAPSKSAMNAWRSSPYESVGIYIGGVNRGCSQPNLSSGWIRDVTGAGWALMPIYVGLQAPGSSCGSCAIIRRSDAKEQGRAAARDAIGDARALGMGSGTPIYFDMEHYARSSTNSRTALRFEEAWTARLHKDGYVSGVYSSASSGIRDLVSRYGSSYLEPDDIWIANWDGRKTTDDPYVPASYWSNHQRIRQYRGGHNESYRGYTINVDSNYLDGAVFGAADRDGDGIPNDFDLCGRVRGPVENSGCPFPSHLSGGLVNYLDSVEGDPGEGDHFTTTGLPGPAYRFDSNLGFLAGRQLPGTAPLSSCTAGRDQFLSRDSTCGGAKLLGTLGYAYAAKPAGIPTRAIYRCRTAAGELTASYDPGCGDPASASEGSLGLTISVATLGRYYDSLDGDRREGDHLTATAGPGPAYRFQANLGMVLNQQIAGTAPLYSCDADRDQFVSRAPRCGGAKVLGSVGFIYVRKPAGLSTRAIYRCRLAKSGELTVSYDRACDAPGNTNEGRLGFTISTATLGRYVNSVAGSPRKGDHFTTTRGVGPAYRFQGNLGFLLNQRLPGTAPLYGCMDDGDQFLSRATDCGGAKVRGLMGWIYTSAPARSPGQAIYRCRRKNGERFTSPKQSCGGSDRKNQGRLGYVSLTPLPR
jgi:hypothetical protein